MSESSHPPLFLDELGAELARVARAEASRRRRTRGPLPVVRTRTLVLTIAATLALAGAAGAGTGLVPLTDVDLTPGGGSPVADGPHFAASSATGRFDPALVRELLLLRRPRTGADSMGDAARHLVGGAPGSSLRLTVPAPADGTPHAHGSTVPAWVVPTPTGTASLQLLAPGADGLGSGVVADAEMLERGRAYMTLDEDLVGLAPDGVRSVTVTLRDGAHVRLPVVENVFGAHLAGGVAGVALDPPPR